MNWVDWIVLGVVGASCFAGLARGAVKTIFSIAGVVLGFFLAATQSGAVGLVLANWLPPTAAAVTGFLFVFLGITAVFSLVGWLIRKTLKALSLGWLDKLAGAVLGFARGAVLVGVLALAVQGMGGLSATAESVTFPYALRAGGILLEMVPEETRQRLDWDWMREWIPEQTRHWKERAGEAI